VIVVGVVADAEIVALASRSSMPVLLDGEGQVARLLRVTVAPAGYAIDRGRQTVGPPLVGPAALLAAARGETVEASTAEPLAFTPLPKRDVAARSPLGPGDDAPRFTLPTTVGAAWPLDAHLGRPFGLVFADPGCPPCRTLLAELVGLDAAGLVVVSRGDPVANRRLGAALGPAATVVVQQNREVARAFGALETPSAYLIDARGAIAAGPALGTEEVLALIDRDGTGAAMDDTRTARAIARGIDEGGR
jgi:peroxiredoxin